MIDIIVWGEYACFTRPEFKVERFSYRVMTPSAARGVLEAVYWKPQFLYRIRRIGVLDLGTETTLLRNEISSWQSAPPKKKSPFEHFLVVENQRQQRTSLILQNVAYRIQARIELQAGQDQQTIGKHLDCFRRRVEKGQYHHKPYLGCREFAADFEPADDSRDQPARLNLPIGTMLFDTAYIEDKAWYNDEAHKEDRLEFLRHNRNGDPREVQGYAKRLFFEANVETGWLNVPQEKYRELEQLEDRHGTA